jgi:hypothetical protein
MVSRLFSKIVEQVEPTIGEHNAYRLIEGYCEQIGVTPENLQPKETGLLVMNLMSYLSEILPKKDWYFLDEKFKHILSELFEMRIKVKGIILTIVIDYIHLKRGKDALRRIEEKVLNKPNFNKDTWYPIYILEDLLSISEEVMLESWSLRSKDIGEYVICENILPNSECLFGTKLSSTCNAFENINEVLYLHKFYVRIDEDNITLSFEGEISNYLKDFFKGICQGILKMRNLKPLSTSTDDSEDPNLVCFKYYFNQGWEDNT